jgi:hypothetical protein
MEPSCLLVLQWGVCVTLLPLRLFHWYFKSSPSPVLLTMIFFYDPSPDDHHGPIAAAREFFLVQGHVVIIDTCPDFTAFQAVHPLRITLHPLSNLPLCVFTKGYARLQELAMAAAIAAPDDPPASHKCIKGVVLDDRCTSLIDCYADIPSALWLAASWPPVLPPGPLPAVGAFPGHPTA